MQLQLKKDNKPLFLIAVLIMCTGSQFFNYGGNTAMAPLLKSLDGYHLYSFVAALGSCGTMITLPAVGALGDKTGRRNIILIGVTLMLIARIAIQFTYSPYLFMVWQFMGSVGSGCVISAPYSMIGSVFPREQAMKYYGLIATFNAIGSLCGPVAAGALVDAGLGRIPFLLFIPFYVFALVVIMVLFPNVKRDNGKKFDVAGLALLAGAVATFVFWTGLSGEGKPLPWLSAGLLLPVGTIICVALLIKHSSKVSNPAVAIRMFKYPRFRVAFFTNLMLVAFSTCASGYLLNYILYVMNKSATIGSTSTVPMTIMIAICGLFMGSILAKNFVKNIRTMMIVSTLCILAALSCFSLLQPDSSMFLVWIGSAIGGIGNSIAQTSLTPFMTYGLPQEEVPAAQGMYQFSSTGGATIFVAFVGVLVNITGSIKPVFYTGTVLAVINVILAITCIKIPAKDVAAVEAAAAKAK
jgi:MFS family permease